MLLNATRLYVSEVISLLHWEAAQTLLLSSWESGGRAAQTCNSYSLCEEG